MSETNDSTSCMRAGNVDAAAAESPAPKRIALWGHGRYGKRLLKVLRRNWSRHYEVTAVFDGGVGEDSEGTTEDGIALFNPARIRAEFEAGRFEAVIISIAKADVTNSLTAQLAEQGIPAITLISREDLHPFEDFEGATEEELPFGFKAYGFHGMRGFYAPLYQWQNAFYLFDDEGRSIEDLWYKDLVDSDPAVLNPAFPFEPDAAETVDIPGECFMGVVLWAKNFWHFTYQVLDKVTLMEMSGFQGKYILARTGFV
ncbi:MAG: hypothetical protein IJH87_01110, partial [Atopobiaceae bacterium]|nr:hypothetical protein [Atopobiaceae bacterium]